MPQNGEINTKFCVYMSSCCGQEMIIREGATFPYCPNHPRMTTNWNPVEADIEDAKVLKKDSKSDPAA